MKWSHLLQMRGLKRPSVKRYEQEMESHLLQMRGLKLFTVNLHNRIHWSHLLQMRGLKLLHHGASSLGCCVASFTDAWIETNFVLLLEVVQTSHLLQMRGLKREYIPPIVPNIKSHLLQMRGLKHDAELA